MWKMTPLSYPESTFETLFIKSVDRRQDLEEFEDALLIVHVGKLLEGLLDQFAQCLGLNGGRERTPDTFIRGLGHVYTQHRDPYPTPLTLCWEEECICVCACVCVIV